MAKQIREEVVTALTIVGIIAAGIAFWKLVAEFMWVCYAAGVPM